MNARKARAIPVLLILALTSACKPKVPAEEVYTPVEGAVGFDAKLESGPANLEQTTISLGSFESAGHVATFRFELGPSDAGNGAVPIRFGKGKFLSVSGSDATGAPCPTQGRFTGQGHSSGCETSFNRPV